jgi:hypothetical protein
MSIVHLSEYIHAVIIFKIAIQEEDNNRTVLEKLKRIEYINVNELDWKVELLKIFKGMLMRFQMKCLKLNESKKLPEKGERT